MVLLPQKDCLKYAISLVPSGSFCIISPGEEVIFFCFAYITVVPTLIWLSFPLLGIVIEFQKCNALLHLLRFLMIFFVVAVVWDRNKCLKNILLFFSNNHLPYLYYKRSLVIFRSVKRQRSRAINLATNSLYAKQK